MRVTRPPLKKWQMLTSKKMLGWSLSTSTAHVKRLDCKTKIHMMLSKEKFKFRVYIHTNTARIGMSNTLEAFKGICNVRKGLDSSNQWKRAIQAMKAMNNLELAQTWIDISNVSLSSSEHEAPIILSQHKTLFKLAIKEINNDNKTPYDCCQDNSSEILQMLKFYHGELQRLTNVVAIEVQMMTDPEKHAVVYHDDTSNRADSIVSKLETALSETNRTLAAMASAAPASAELVSELKEQISNTKVSIAAIAESSAALARATATQPVTSKLAELESKLSETNGAISAIAASVVDLSNAVSQIHVGEKLAEISGANNEIKQQLNALADQKKDLASKMDQMPPQIENLGRTVAEHKAQLDTQMARIDSALETCTKQLVDFAGITLNNLQLQQSSHDSAINTLAEKERNALKAIRETTEASQRSIEFLNTDCRATHERLQATFSGFTDRLAHIEQGSLFEKIQRDEEAAIEKINEMKKNSCEAIQLLQTAVEENITLKGNEVLESVDTTRITLKDLKANNSLLDANIKELDKKLEIVEKAAQVAQEKAKEAIQKIQEPPDMSNTMEALSKAQQSALAALERKEQIAIKTIEDEVKKRIHFEGELVLPPKLEQFKKETDSKISKIRDEHDKQVKTIEDRLAVIDNLKATTDEISGRLTAIEETHTAEKIQEIQDSVTDINGKMESLTVDIGGIKEILSKPSTGETKTSSGAETANKTRIQIENVELVNRLREAEETMAKKDEAIKKLKARSEAREQADAVSKSKAQSTSQESIGSKPPAARGAGKTPAKPAAHGAGLALSIPPSGLRPRVILLHRPTLPSSAR